MPWELAERWGPVLLAAGLLYSVLALLLSLAAASGGVSLGVSLVPDSLLTLYRDTYAAWQSVSSVMGQSVDILQLPIVMYNITRAIINSILSLLAVFAMAVFAFIVIAVEVSRLVPPPFTIVNVVVWVVMSTAEIIVVYYVMEKVWALFQQFAAAASSLISRIPL